MISQTAEYALRAAVHLARSTPQRRTGEQISGTTGVPYAYLAKVMQALVRAGIVDSRRGRNGGFRLQRPNAEINILEIINAVDPLQRIESCPLDLPEHCDRLCALHERIDAALKASEDAFRATSLAQILADPGPQWPLGAPEPGDSIPSD
jgi:Rrf2 family protein